jgi:Icc-related predicted phosphoesterase
LKRSKIIDRRDDDDLRCFHVSDLHGKPRAYDALFRAAESERPRAVLIGGDILPNGGRDILDFADSLIGRIEDLRSRTEGETEFILILGNDDPRVVEDRLIRADEKGILHYIHDRAVEIDGITFRGLSYVPPTPFALKDWERYDVSRYVDPGAVSPEEGMFSVEVDMDLLRQETIWGHLEPLLEKDMSRTVFLFHSPPHDTMLDDCDIHGRMFDHAPLDPHIGSIAIRRFLMAAQPLVSLHGHVHESTRLSGSFIDSLGSSPCINAAHEGDGLSLIRFDTYNPRSASRTIIS